MSDFILYGTEGCHLCEEAEQLLLQVGLDFCKQDIIDDERLQQCYAIRIPVLKCRFSGLELGWPFSHESLMKFLEDNQA